MAAPEDSGARDTVSSVVEETVSLIGAVAIPSSLRETKETKDGRKIHRIIRVKKHVPKKVRGVWPLVMRLRILLKLIIILSSHFNTYKCSSSRFSSRKWLKSAAHHHGFRCPCHSTRPSSVGLRECPEGIRAFPSEVGIARTNFNMALFIIR
jgi:hypothetical protein